MQLLFLPRQFVCKSRKKDQQIYLFDARTEMYMFALYFTLILKHF